MKSKKQIGTTIAGLVLTAAVGGWALNTVASAFNKAAAASTDYQLCSFNFLLPKTNADAQFMEDHKVEVSNRIAEIDKEQPPLESALIPSMLHDYLAEGKTVTIKNIDGNCYNLNIR